MIKNIDKGVNAYPFVAKGAPLIAGTMRPLATPTINIRQENGHSSTKPYFETGYTRDHIGPHDLTDTSVLVGGTDVKAQRCILLNYGTDWVEPGPMKIIRQRLHSRMPSTDIPARNPIGYTQEDANAVFAFWHKAFMTGDTTSSRMVMTIPSI